MRFKTVIKSIPLILLSAILFNCSSDPVTKLEARYWDKPPIYYDKYNVIQSIYNELLNQQHESSQNSLKARILLWRCAVHLGKTSVADSLRPIILNSNPHIYKPLTTNFNLEDEKLRSEIIYLLAEKRNPELFGFFKNALQNDEYYIVQKAAAYALGKLKNPDILPLLIERSKHSDPAIRTYAIESLGNFKQESAINRLTEIVLDDHELDDIRYIAGNELSSVLDSASINKLSHRFEHNPGKADLFIANAIAAFNKSQIIRNIIGKYINDPNPFYEGIAIEIIGKMHDSTSLPVLESKLKYGNRHIRIKVVQTLVKFSENSYAIELLEQAGKDANETVAREARNALMSFAYSTK